ncbi:MAG: pitrilysin family protein, partial [Pseudomonadota bacterium]
GDRPGPVKDERNAEGAASVAWEPETFQLDNGMQVVVLPDRRAPVVTHMVWYRVGSADEVSGKTGIAHFLEHLMFKGTAKLKPGEFSKIVARNGGRDNAFTSFDYTAYFQRVARDRLPLMMRMEADRMTGLRLVDAEVYPERDVVLEERRMRIDNNPQAQLSEQMSAALFHGHGYGAPIIGWMDEVSQLTRQDAEAFYRLHYGPDNAILIVAGDISAKELKPLAEKYYGGIPSADLPERVRANATPPAETKRIVLRDERVTEPTVSRFQIAPSYATAEPGEAEAIDVMMQILGAPDTGRLYRELVVEQRIAASAGGWYQGDALGQTRLGIYGAPVQGGALQAVEAGLEASIQRLIDNGLEPGELERAKSSMVAAATYALDSQETMAQVYGVGLTTGSTIQDIVAWPDRIAAVTAEQVIAAARAYLDVDNAVIGELLPKGRS